MKSLIIRIVLVASLFFNAALYYGWMDIGQYRSYIDNLAKDGQKIIESEQFQSLLTSVQDKIQELYDKNFSDIESELLEKIQEEGKDAAIEYIKEKYSQLTDSDIQTIIDEATSDEETEDTTDGEEEVTTEE